MSGDVTQLAGEADLPHAQFGVRPQRAALPLERVLSRIGRFHVPHNQHLFGSYCLNVELGELRLSHAEPGYGLYWLVVVQPGSEGVGLPVDVALEYCRVGLGDGDGLQVGCDQEV